MELTTHYLIQKGIEKADCDDSALIGNTVINEGIGMVKTQVPSLICIADGVGGNRGGKDASLFLMKEVSMQLPGKSVEEYRRKLLDINENLIVYGKNIGKPHMATTLTGVFLDTDVRILMHTGNTRLYSVQGSYLKQISEDQTTYQWLIAHGDKEAAELCNRSEINSAFGNGNADTLQNLVVEEVFQRGFPSQLLMTSDGIHDYLSIDEMEEILGEEDPEKALHKLVDLARTKGSEDDCTVLMISVE